MARHWVGDGLFYFLPNLSSKSHGGKVIITLTYKEAAELLHYLKAWDTVRNRSESGEIKFDTDKIEYKKSTDEVKVEILP